MIAHARSSDITAIDVTELARYAAGGRLVEKLKRRAARHGRSAEAEHRKFLRQALSAEVEPDFDRLASELRKLTAGRNHTLPKRCCAKAVTQTTFGDTVIPLHEEARL